MPPDTVPVETLQRSLSEAGRALSTATILFHQLVARQLGLNDSDHKCLDLLMRHGDMTAGALAERSGFTTGAVTGLAKRLIARGFVRRGHDKRDLRRVVLRPVPAKVHARMGPLLMPMIERMAAVHSSYRPEELTLLLDYLGRCTAVMHESAAELAARAARE